MAKGYKGRSNNEPDDIRNYDHDPRSPYFEDPAIECSYCGRLFKPDGMYEDDMCKKCSEQLDEE